MDVNITIIGAGVIGLAIAAKLSEKYDNIFVIEKHNKFGQETSSRNSEVIHSGIYYKTDSLKAKLCVKGRDMLYKYCDENDVDYSKCAKLIVATNNDEVAELDRLKAKAEANGVMDLKLINEDEATELEPNVKAVKALLSPSSGIIDTYGLMKSLETKSVNNAVEFAYASELKSIKKIEGGYELMINDAEGFEFPFTSKIVINSAGLNAANVWEMLGKEKEEYKIHYCKGEYFTIDPPKNHLIKRLIYPVPAKNLKSLGIHATIDLSGGAKLGPNAYYLKENNIDYSVDKSNKQEFFEAAKRYLEFLEIDDISADQAGIRPKIQKEGEEAKDFIIKNEIDEGFDNFINLVGMESPGLTASLAIAEYIEELLN